MFALANEDLDGARILDCPSGAASFVAEANARTATAVAADPVFALDDIEVGRRAREDLDRCDEHMHAAFENYVWDFYESPNAHTRRRLAALARFRDDLAANPDAYVPARLPRLPFANGEFGLGLSSHFLFCYADRLDLRFHLLSIRELARVSKEVRIYPVVGHDGTPYVDLTHLRRVLRRDGYDTELVAVEMRFLEGADAMLVVRGRSRGKRKPGQTRGPFGALLKRTADTLDGITDDQTTQTSPGATSETHQHGT